MAKRIQIVCDCCGTPLTPANWLMDEEVCNNCILVADIAAEGARRDVLNKDKPGTTIANILKLYGVKTVTKELEMITFQQYKKYLDPFYKDTHWATQKTFESALQGNECFSVTRGEGKNQQYWAEQTMAGRKFYWSQNPLNAIPFTLDEAIQVAKSKRARIEPRVEVD